MHSSRQNMVSSSLQATASQQLLDLDEWCKDCDAAVPQRSLTNYRRRKQMKSEYYRRLPGAHQRLWCGLISGTASTAVALPFAIEPLTRFVECLSSFVSSIW